MAKSKKSKAARVKERQERRFLPLPAANETIVNVFGGLAAAVLGAGVFAQFGHGWLDNPAPPYPFAPGLIAGGAVACAAAVWLGTSGEAVLRVGSGGIGIEKSKDVVRIPWHKIDRIVWDPDRSVLLVNGKDEAGREQHLALAPKVHPAAIGWIIREGQSRIPLSVDVPEEAHGMPVAQQGDGEILAMDPIQVVGKRCAESNRIIAYEPDARVCVRCERVYYRTTVPEACACGASLEGQRDAVVEGASEPAKAKAKAKGEPTSETKPSERATEDPVDPAKPETTKTEEAPS